MALSDYLPTQTTTIEKGGKVTTKSNPPQKNIAGDIKNLVSKIVDAYHSNRSQKLISPVPENSAPILGSNAPAVQGAGTTADSFGVGNEPAYIEPRLFQALMGIPNENIRMKLAELSGQESSYGYAGPQITPKEKSYGPYHINLLSGRVNPETGKPFTQKEAEDPEVATRYAMQEYLRTGGLGSWNPGSYNFYQYDLPTRATSKKFMKGK